MKRPFFYVITLLLLTFTGSAQAQSLTFDDISGNSGVDKPLLWNFPDNYGVRFTNTSSNSRGYLHLQVRHNTSTWSNLLTFSSRGNIGINNPTPPSGHLLDINGPVNLNGRLGFPTASTTAGSSPGIVHNPGHIDEFLYDGQYINHYGFGFHNYDEEGISVNGTNTYVSAFFGIDFFTRGRHRVRINNNGNFGIKTNNPKYSLQIGNGETNESLTLAGTPSSSNSSFLNFQKGTTSEYVRLQFNAASKLLKITSDLGDIMSFDGVNKNVGIGNITALNPNNYLLAVNGKIGAKEIIVENTSTTWPDYVFEKDYPLSSLEEVEQFIQTNKHLPEIPAATEVKETGINIGDMNAVLLKKIEELTLYLIDQNKRINLLQEEITELKKQ